MEAKDGDDFVGMFYTPLASRDTHCNKVGKPPVFAKQMSEAD